MPEKSSNDKGKAYYSQSSERVQLEETYQAGFGSVERQGGRDQPEIKPQLADTRLICWLWWVLLEWDKLD